MVDQRSPLSFREKSAWISLALLIVLFGAMFTNFARLLTGHGALIPVFWTFALMFAAVVGEVVLQIVIAMRSPTEARTPKDERERLIDLRATRVAFFVLLAGGLLTVFFMHVRFEDPGDRPWLMGHIMIFSILAAGIVKFGIEIALNRRDA
jgi:hypothetical protein